MRFKLFITVISLLVFAAGSFVNAETEDEIVNKYLNRLEKKHVKKVSWISGSFNFHRINRDNDYNKFANYESNNLTGGEFSWLGDGFNFGLDMGVIFNRRFAWSVGGEYWMQMGEELSGTYSYLPTATTLENPKSEIKLYGISTGLQYYLMNPPTEDGILNGLAVRAGGTVGFYQVSWDLWSEYENLNLATNSSTGNNTTFKDNSAGFSFGMGIDYPLNFLKMNVGVDFNYLYLNFDNVAWYNQVDDEVVATYDGTSDGRVDLGFSGFKGKVEIKRFFSW